METFEMKNVRDDHEARWRTVCMHDKEKALSSAAKSATAMAKVLDNELVDADGKIKMHYDIYLSHLWGADALGRMNEARSSAIGKLLVRHGFGIHNCDDSKNDMGTLAQVRLAVQTQVKQSRVFAILLTENYKDELMSNRFVKSQCTDQYNCAITEMKPEQIVVLVMEPAMLPREGNWGDQLNDQLGACEVFDCSASGLSVESPVILQIVRCSV
jgi:hypothetical protein